MKRTATILSVLAGAAALLFFLTRPERDPLSLTFVRYEKVTNKLYGVFHLRNNTFRGVDYLSSGPEDTTYLLQTPTYSYTHSLGDSHTNLAAGSTVAFRVPLLHTDEDWRVGISWHEFSKSSWIDQLPPALGHFLGRFASWIGLTRRGGSAGEVWSLWIPRWDEMHKAEGIR